MKKKLKAALSMFLCAVMVLCSVAVGGMFANADTSTGKAIQLVKDGAAANISGGQASNIYFGNYAQSDKTGKTKDPIKWRVLANNTSSKQLFLLSDQALDTVKYHTENENVTWEKSTIRSWLNGTFYKAAFNSSEQGMIKSTKVTADANPSHNNTDPGNDTTDQVFLLSINEVNKYFSSDDARKCVPTDYAVEQGAFTSDNCTVDGKATCWWWLRSPGSNSSIAAYVYSGGGVSYSGRYVSYASFCVRPALNLNLESVIFTSAAEGGKISSAEGGDALSKITDYSGNDWKVTLKDANRKFDITDKTAKSGKPGDTITLSYSGATIYNKDSAPNEYISVIITDSTGDAIYYGRITQPTSTFGNVSITIPTDLDAGQYTLNVFSEQYNGGANDDTKLTDYASAFSAVDLTVEPYEISVNFDENSGDWTKGYTPPTSYISNQTLTMPTKDNISRTGYTFDGWELSNTSSRTVKNYIAKWKINQYTLTFVLGNGEKDVTIKQDYNTNVTAPTPTRVGYIFNGWDKTVPATMPADNITYTAQWLTCDHKDSTNKPTCTESAVCSICSKVLSPLGHSFDENGKCTVCNIQKIANPTANENLTYTGEVQTGVNAGTGYTLINNTGTNAGSYTATATLSDGYIWSDESSLSKNISWSIAQKEITPTVNIEKDSYEYTKEQIKPIIKVYDDKKEISADEYDVTYSNNIELGIATVTVKSKETGNYKFSTTKNFTITKADPTYDKPSNLEGVYGLTLSTIELPKGWSWVDGTVVMNTMGNQEYSAKYTPTDTEHYNEITVSLPVNVKEHEHKWSSEWSHDETYHWHECTADGTCTIADNAKKDGYAAHNGGKATCTEDGFCADCKVKYLDAIGHTYANSSFTWADDNTAKVTFTCSNDETHKLTEDCKITSETTKKATCTEKGEITYTASYTLDNKEYKDEKKVPTDATGHDFSGNPTVTKATFFKDGSKVYHCTHDGCTETRTEITLSTINRILAWFRNIFSFKF